MPLRNLDLPFTLHALWDGFLLRRVEQEAATYPASRLPRMRELLRAANDRARVANDLVEGHVPSAMTLFREAALLYMAAFVAIHSDDPPAETLAPDDVRAQFQQVVQSRALPADFDEAELDRLAGRDRSDDLLAFDRLRLDSPDALAEARAAQQLVRRLAGLTEPRAVSELRFERGVRLVILGLALCGLLVWGAVNTFGRTNIALHKSVTASGLHPTAPAPPGGLTDGVTTGSYGIHTSNSDNPWVQLDLGAVFPIDRVKVYNRGDGWFDDGLPMTLQFSEDGATFVDIETRTTNFGQFIPWTAKAHGKKARHVRVRGGKGKYVALSEIEVFGGKP